ncbi:MAG: DUF814 domain-containing protein [Balneola sp.]|nr:MAG: DUF814 domain-containing protein [Balneola sp.]
MNYYELIYLKRELKNKLSNAVIELATTPFKNTLELYIKGDSESSRLIFNTSPGNISLFLDSYRPPKKANRITFFEDVYLTPIQGVELVKNDRIISIEFGDGKALLFKLFSSRANAYLIEEGIIAELFKDFGEIGSATPKAKSQTLFEVTGEGKTAKKILIESNPMLPRADLDDLVNYHGLEELTTDGIIEFSKELTTALENEAEFRLLTNGETTVFPERIFPSSTERFFESINELILWRTKNYSGRLRFNQRKNIHIKSLKKQLQRTEAVLKNLEKAEGGLNRAQDYEQKGHILMANAHKGMPESTKLIAVDFYNNNEELVIEVNQELSIAENASKFYERSSNSKKSYFEAREKIPVLKQRKDQLVNLISKLDEVSDFFALNDWEKKNKDDLILFKNTSNNEKNAALPFHLMDVLGYEIWIGKNAKSNDKLVQLSHKEDVWLHARGVSGSHVIIRMRNQKSMPDKEVVQKVAAYAAYNSKAKGAGLVPVIYTKRKFVRKPKGAAPGAVLVQKEQVEFVEPEKP